MELCEGGDQFDHLYAQPGARYGEDDARKLLTKMLRALAYLHGCNIVHRDLKLENFILTDKSPAAEIKMIDFGLSRAYLGSSSMSNVVGTAYYIAPEVLQQSYTQASDLWSLGVIAYMMLTGIVPFGGKTDKDIMENVSRAAKNEMGTAKRIFATLTKAGVSSAGADFVLKLLTVNPETRMTSANGLAHVWISNTTKSRLSTLENFSL